MVLRQAQHERFYSVPLDQRTLILSLSKDAGTLHGGAG